MKVRAVPTLKGIRGQGKEAGCCCRTYLLLIYSIETRELISPGSE